MLADNCSSSKCQKVWRLPIFLACQCLIGCIASLATISGCNSDSTLDSVLNTNSDSSQPSLTGPGGLGGTTSKNGASTNSRVPGAPTIPLDAETHISGPAGSSPNALNIGGDISDIPILVDHARISREDFVVNLSLAARTLLLEQTKKSGQSYLLVGKVTTTTDDWQHISFVDFYDQDRHFQFRNNGVKILVPRELVNRLHNATIELDPITKQYFVKLASPTP